MSKYIFVTGGVVSSLGRGSATALRYSPLHLSCTLSSLKKVWVSPSCPVTHHCPVLPALMVSFWSLPMVTFNDTGMPVWSPCPVLVMVFPLPMKEFYSFQFL